MTKISDKDLNALATVAYAARCFESDPTMRDFTSALEILKNPVAVIASGAACRPATEEDPEGNEPDSANVDKFHAAFNAAYRALEALNLQEIALDAAYAAAGVKRLKTDQDILEWAQAGLRAATDDGEREYYDANIDAAEARIAKAAGK